MSLMREMEAEAVSGGGRPGGLGPGGPALEQTASYTIPGILHFIKHEWSRFERERANWDVERSELQVRGRFCGGGRLGKKLETCLCMYVCLVSEGELSTAACRLGPVTCWCWTGF